jgi:hypothetical protein
MAFLTEPGREGMFVWAIGDQSAYVTADTAQGVYVAPAVDTTGASGAWVRRLDGYLRPEWFGAVFDSTPLGAVGTDDSVAILATVAMSKTLASNVSRTVSIKPARRSSFPLARPATWGQQPSI